MFPQANIPSVDVSIFSFTIGPDVDESIAMPHFDDISFSGIRPTDRSTVSHSMYSSVPGIGFLWASTLLTVTPVTRSLPWISVIVWLNFNGMLKFSTHWTMFLVRPAEKGITSQTSFTSAPSRVRRRAIIRPMSPEPRITTFLPGR